MRAHRAHPSDPASERFESAVWTGKLEGRFLAVTERPFEESSSVIDERPMEVEELML
jgi:hypothetical protein